MISAFQVLSAIGSVADQNEIMDFFKGLVDAVMDRDDANARLDFLACPLSASNEGIQVLKSLEEYVKVELRMQHNLSYISEIYYQVLSYFCHSHMHHSLSCISEMCC